MISEEKLENLKGMTSTKTRKRSQPTISYQLAENEGGSLGNAFDILFEETLRQNNDLTTNDN